MSLMNSFDLFLYSSAWKYHRIANSNFYMNNNTARLLFLCEISYNKRNLLLLNNLIKISDSVLKSLWETSAYIYLNNLKNCC